MMDKETLTVALKKALPPEFHNLCHSLAELLIASVQEHKSVTETHIEHDFSQALKALMGQKLILSDTALTFGEQSQFGDIQIRDVAGGSIINLHINTSLHRVIEPMVIKPENEYPSLSDANPDDQFSPSVIYAFEQLYQKVEGLTQEQYRVIQMLRGEHRVRITGAAGSGKTLVAVEKAIRLSTAGMRVLFLCHNPLLAEHVKSLSRGTGVTVESFARWVIALSGLLSEDMPSTWSNYEEPSSYALELAFDHALALTPRYDAIIVDEGQDFREEWWILVEAALVNPQNSILYIFHDDHQSLLPYRAIYPITKPVVDLSRNCRNAGNIYHVMRHLQQNLPEGEPGLVGQGKATFIQSIPGEEVKALQKVLQVLNSLEYNSIAMLLGGNYSLENCPLLYQPIVANPKKWRDAVIGQFEIVIRNHDPNGIILPSRGASWITQELSMLSREDIPNARDVALVRKVARAFTIREELRDRLLRERRSYLTVKWEWHQDTPRLRRFAHRPIWPSEIILHFEREDWHLGLPTFTQAVCAPYYDTSDETTILAYNIGDYKGLEADVIILAVSGRVPQIEQQLYVGISRARLGLIGLLDNSTIRFVQRDWIMSDGGEE